MIESKETIEANVETFSAPQQPFIREYRVADSIPRDTPVHKLNRMQRERMKMLSQQAFGCTSRWQKMAAEPKFLGYEIDKARTQNTDKPKYKVKQGIYTADEIEQNMEKRIILKTLPEDQVKQIQGLWFQVFSKGLWESEYLKDPRPACKSEDIFKDIIFNLQAMIEYNKFAGLSTSLQISKIVTDFKSNTPPSVPVTFLVNNDTKDELATLLASLPEGDRTRFMEMVNSEKINHHFHFDAVEVVKAILAPESNEVPKDEIIADSLKGESCLTESK